MIYLIRHAEKEDSTVYAKLTPKGLKDSFLYGEKLKLNNIAIDLIISSPIDRCIQTAKEISKGYGYIAIQESTLLGNPGIYINDDKKAMEIFNKLPLIKIINMQLSKKRLDGFNNIETATKKLLLFIKNNNDNILYISHDAIITPFINYIENINKIEQYDIVNYLDGYSNCLEHLTKPWKRTKLP